MVNGRNGEVKERLPQVISVVHTSAERETGGKSLRISRISVCVHGLVLEKEISVLHWGLEISALSSASAGAGSSCPLS